MENNMVQLVDAIMKSWNMKHRKTIFFAVNINCTKSKQFDIGRQEWELWKQKKNKILSKSPLHICNHYIKKKINILVEDKGNFLAVRDQHKVALLTIRYALQK